MVLPLKSTTIFLFSIFHIWGSLLLSLVVSTVTENEALPGTLQIQVIDIAFLNGEFLGNEFISA